MQGLVEDIEVEQYGQRMPLRHVANISINGQEILSIHGIKVFLEFLKSNSGKSELGLNPVNNGVALRINVPPY